MLLAAILVTKEVEDEPTRRKNSLTGGVISDGGFFILSLYKALTSMSIAVSLAGLDEWPPSFCTNSSKDA